MCKFGDPEKERQIIKNNYDLEKLMVWENTILSCCFFLNKPGAIPNI